uniref:DNA ligase n=1 Tax=Lygus hesperus TaxID=30085 RepID=A0A0A9XD96_LYGHE
MSNMGFVTLRRKKNGDKRNAEVFAFTNEEIARMYRSKIPTPLRTKCCSRIGALDKAKIGVTSCRDEVPEDVSGKKSKRRQVKPEVNLKYLGKGKKDTLGVKPATVPSERKKCGSHRVTDNPRWSHHGPEAYVHSETLWPALRRLLVRIKELFWIRNSSYRGCTMTEDRIPGRTGRCHPYWTR